MSGLGSYGLEITLMSAGIVSTRIITAIGEWFVAAIGILSHQSIRAYVTIDVLVALDMGPTPAVFVCFCVQSFCVEWLLCLVRHWQGLQLA